MQLSPDFSPIPALFGGMIIGFAALFLLAFQGKIAGISGILRGVLIPKKGDYAWRLCFILGLIFGGYLVARLAPTHSALMVNDPGLKILVAGFAVGYGTTRGSGCTSGHGICGLARRSKRSLVSVVVFMLTAFITFYLNQHYGN